MKEQLLDFDSLLIVLGVLGKKKKLEKPLPYPLRDFLLLDPPPLRIPLPLREEGGMYMDIFWNYTMAFLTDFFNSNLGTQVGAQNKDFGAVLQTDLLNQS